MGWRARRCGWRLKIYQSVKFGRLDAARFTRFFRIAVCRDTANLSLCGDASTRIRSCPPHVPFDITGKVNWQITQMQCAGKPLNGKDLLLSSRGKTRVLGRHQPPHPALALTPLRTQHSGSSTRIRQHPGYRPYLA